MLGALRDGDEQVRRHGLVMAERLFVNGDASPALLGQLRDMITDPSLRVRYQLAFTLGNLQRADKAVALGRLLAADFSEPWMRYAVLSSGANGAGNLFSVLAADSRFRSDPIGFDFLTQLASLIGVSGNQDSVNQASSFVARGDLAPAQADQFLYGLGDGLYRTRSSLALVDTQGLLPPYYSSALNLAADTSQPDSARAAATRLSGSAPSMWDRSPIGC